MRVNKIIVLDIATGRELERVAVEYYGKVARAKSGGGSTTTQSLPKWLTPYAKDFIESYGSEAFVTNPDGSKSPIGMPGDLTMQNAGFTPEQLAAFQNMAGMTGGAQALANTGGMNAGATLGGAYLHPESNPYLSGTYDAAARKMTDAYQSAVAPGIMASAQRQGQFGSSAMEELMAMSRYDLGENLGNLGTSIYGGNYAAERDRQIQTMSQLPNTINSLYAPQTYLAGVGAQQQEQQQAEFDTSYTNAANAAEWPFNILSGFGAALGQAAGGGGTSSTKSTTPGMFGSHLCSETRRQGRMSDEMWAADTEFGKTLPQDVRAGYELIALPIAKAMRQSPLLSNVIIPFVLLWGKEMQRRVTGEGEGSRFGKFVLWAGLPLCKAIGRAKGIQWAQTV